MFKDDRFISILSGVVLMVAIGTVVQRGGPLMRVFGGGPAVPELRLDRAEVDAGGTVVIRPFENDEGLEPEMRDRLVVIEGPSCGIAEADGRTLSYNPDVLCSGEHVVRYGISGLDGATGEIRITVNEVPAAPAAASEAVAEAPDAGPADGTDAQEPAVAAAPDPVVRTVPGRPSAPSLRADADQSLALAPAAPAAPVARNATEMPDQLDQGATRETAPSGPAVIVEQPGQVALRAPGQLNTRPGGARENDFAAAQSRGGLLARPVRASTQATPSAAALAAAAEADRRPVRGDVAEQIRSETLASAPATPDIGGLTAPQATDDGLALAAPAASGDSPVARAPGGLAPQSPDTAGPQAPVTAGGSAADPVRRPSIPEVFRLGGTPGADRVSELSPPPTVSDGRPNTGDGPSALRPTTTISLARVNRDEAAFTSPSVPNIGRPAGLGSTSTPAPMPAPGGATDRLALADPSSGLGDIRNLGGGLTIVPVDTSALPSGLSAPVASGGSTDDVALPVLSFDPDAVAVAPSSADGGATGSDVEVEEERLAALPSATAPCTTPPALTYDPRDGAMTEVIVISPCHAGQVATLSYSGIDLAFRIDRGGKGQLRVPGFESRSGATLNMPDGSTLDFELPFEDTNRVIRVALAWDQPVLLELHALPNGVRLGESSHLTPRNTGSFDDVRRRGGGFMTVHPSIDGFGTNLQVYTHYVRRRSGTPDVVRLMIDFASRRAGSSEETCGRGRYAAPAFRVMRSEQGMLERPLNRRLGALACESVARLESHLIEAAVEDIVVSFR